MGLVYHVFKGGGPSARKKAFGLFVRSGSIIKNPEDFSSGFFIIGEPPWSRTKHNRLKRAVLYLMS